MMSMYSLYRAWLLRENSSIASNSLSMPPDLIINILNTPSSSPYQFIAHKIVISNHSMYLKSLILNQEDQQQILHTNESTHSINELIQRSNQSTNHTNESVHSINEIIQRSNQSTIHTNESAHSINEIIQRSNQSTIHSNESINSYDLNNRNRIESLQRSNHLSLFNIDNINRIDSSSTNPTHSFDNINHSLNLLRKDIPNIVGRRTIEITVPSSIPLNTFSSLLTFMYTGFLDLNLNNIYDTLLASNILHMPHALDLCRSFLLHNVHSVANLTFNNNNNGNLLGQQQNIIKPIPERNIPTTLLNLSNIKNESSNKIEDNQNELVQNNKDLIQNNIQIKESNHENIIKNESNQKMNLSTPTNLKIINTKNNNIQINKKRRLSRRPSLQQRRSKISLRRLHSPIIDSDSSDDVTVVTTEIKKRHSNGSINDNSNIIYDIASCDGPVHFHKVLNENYIYSTTAATTTVNKTIQKPDNKKKLEGSKDLPVESLENKSNNNDTDEEINIDDNSSDIDMENENHEETEENIQRHLLTENSFRLNFRNQIQNQQIENISNNDSESNEKESNFKCSICFINFKNEISLDRHKLIHQTLTNNVGNNGINQNRSTNRRIIPKTILKQLTNNGSSSTATTSSKREVKLLDMNVQYYPCKTCGAKFPSYYFVHKHRRMYHPEEELITNTSSITSNNVEDIGGCQEVQQPISESTKQE